jgi:hypothetical protein
MRAYDERGRRIPTRRTDGRAGILGIVVFAIIEALTVLLVAYFAYRYAEAVEDSKAPLSTGPSHDSMAIGYDYQGEATRFYVMTDPDTGIQYVWSDNGGLSPRYDRYGRVMGVIDEV